MQCINKARLLTDIEREFIKTSKRDRTKKKFKNPSVIRDQLKDKSKNILLTIPELINDIDLLYKFGVEEENIKFLEFYDSRKMTIGDFRNVGLINFVLGLYSPYSTDKMFKLVESLNSMDAKKIMFLATSSLFLGLSEEYKAIAKKTYFNIEGYEKWIESPHPRIVSLFDNIYSSLADREQLLEVLHGLSANYEDTLAKDVLPAAPPIMETLKSLSPHEKIVALEILKSEKISRNEIEKNTGLHKKFVTRYTNSLVKKSIIKSKNIGGKDYFQWMWTE